MVSKYTFKYQYRRRRGRVEANAKIPVALNTEEKLKLRMECIRVGDKFYAEGKYTLAYVNYNDAINTYGTSRQGPEIFTKRSLVNDKLGKAEEAARDRKTAEARKTK